MVGDIRVSDCTVRGVLVLQDGISTPGHAVIAADPVSACNPALVAAAARSGGVGLLDVASDAELAPALADLARRGVRRCWLRPGPGLTTGLPDGPLEVEAVVVPADRLDAWLACGATHVIAQITSRDQAEEAVAAGAGGLIASGSEAGGRVGHTEAFILFQQVADLGVPVWVRGGIGLHTASAVAAGGGAGVVLDAQLALTPESSLGTAARRAVETMDGSETRVVGGHRILTRPDLPAAALGDDAAPAVVAARLGADLHRHLLPLGQDGGFASDLAQRFATVGGIVQAVTEAMAHHLRAAAAHPPLAPGAGVAAVHGTAFPIAQGPMTRVSDRAGFALSVAQGGGLPFLALALMSGPEVRALLEETAALLGDLPWGVGILGFVPPELRAEQLDVVHDVAPPVALIAGGRPSQAQPLEAAGIATYLHVPSPGLLDRFVKDGARRFVFEGRECGGHVGPRSSFALWDAQIARLMEVPDPERLQVLLAGGIHDARSAAMAAAAAAPLAARGASIGVLMGTAYLFTEEAVAGGAIQPAFQDVAVGCHSTVLLETAPGHATRCVETDYVRAFATRRDELVAAGVEPKARWAELESLNLGRLRIASKALVRGDGGLEEVDETYQRREGMYMIGEVATLRSEVTTVADLHREVSEGSTAWLSGADPGPAGGLPALSHLVVREPPPAPDPLDIAIVGMETFMPGSVGVEEFWASIVRGTDAVGEVPAERWDVARYYDPDAFTRDAGRKTPSRWGGFLPRIGFDALQYGIPPASLAAIEPVQLLSLEVAARALADAGYGRRAFDRERASVVFGAEAGNDLAGAYGIRAFLPQLFGEVPPGLEDWLPSLTEDSFPGVLANVIAGRIANRLDLGGVNYTVDAACASSLAALDAACKELRAGTSDLVLCGGADLHNGLNDYLLFASVHALSPSGRCRTFDAAADGIALGEGIACVVLKRLADAERDGDRIYAVVDAVAGSSDGRFLGLTAPRKEGQQRAVHRALAQAGGGASTIGLVEAHGTGTVVGDRTEMATLTEVFQEGGARPAGTVLGSVKSQIGHTKCAAGLAGLVKAAKAVHHGVLPPTVNLVEPNPYYDAETSPFRFLDQARPWVGERRAGVSAFGFGGTNFHTILSAYGRGDAPAHGVDRWPAELVLVRGSDLTVAKDRAADLARTVGQVLATDPGGQRHPLRDLAAATCRAGSGPVQLALVATDLADLAAKLEQAARGEADHRGGVYVADPTRDTEAPTVAFLYPGQGSQRPAMTSDLFTTFGGLADLAELAEPWADALFPPAAFNRDERAAQQERITATDVAQPALGVASLALTRLLRRVGVEPGVAAGHSYGELAALAAAGSFDDATLLDLSAARGRAILDAVAGSGGDPGAMAAVELARHEVEPMLAAWPGVVLANHNGPRQVVISGPTSAVRQAATDLEAAGTKVKLLPVACAFHSPLVAAAGTQFGIRLAEAPIAAPTFPVWSNATAEPYPAGDHAAVARLLAEQVATGVRFVEQIEAMYEAGARVFVEAGPGRVLTQQVGKILGERPHHMVATDVSGESGVARFLMAVAELAVLGVPVDAEPLYERRAHHLDLASLPLAAPGWSIDGAHVRTADGRPLPNSLQPADTLPSGAVAGALLPAYDPEGTRSMAHAQGPTGPASVSDDATAVVLEYLRGVRQVVAAERDVVLRYLGAAPAASPLDAPGAPIVATARPAVAATGTPVSPSGPADPEPTPALTGAELMKAVQAIVSERTGYPVEMLDPDLDLEADLSIDSIKRIEIVGELAERIGLAGLDEAAVDEEMVEELAQHKTLRAIVDWIEALAGGEASPTTVVASEDAHHAHEPVPHVAVPPVSQRYEVEVLPLGPAVPRGDLDGARAGVVAGHDGLTAAVVDALTRRGAAVTSLDRAAPSTERADAVGMLDVLVDLSTTATGAGCDARTVFPDLQAALLGKARRILAATVAVHPDGRPTGVPGLMRAVARERHDALVRAVEVDLADLDGDLGALAEALADELLDLDAPAALSWAGGQRTTRTVGAAKDLGGAREIGLGPDAVVVVTGGARGITARVAEGLARANPCRLVLVGRTPFPADDEDPRTAGAQDRTALRRALLEIGELTSPHEIEAACARIEAAREVRASVALLRSFGADVTYHALDVRSEELGDLLDAVHASLGRLDGVIHGAGVLDDHFLRDKTVEGFARVFATKVDAARTILQRVPLGLRFVVLFGSVSGVFGNRGQSDYAAANDALDALARAHDPDSGCRVVSIDWGPWGGGGMVSPELEREYGRRGIGLVDPGDGVLALLHEVATAVAGEPGPAQLVVMRGAPEAFAPPIDHTAASDDLVGGFTGGD